MTNGLEEERETKYLNEHKEWAKLLFVSKNKIMPKRSHSLDDLFVYKPRSHKLRVVQPHEESTLDNVIKRNPAHNESHDTFRN